jgi:two-component system, chemotaxis family, protein-glutamate methylesterase/glutaminase
MMEEPVFIRRRISHYGALSKLDLNDENRATIARLLAEAERELEVAAEGELKAFPVVCVGGSAGGLAAYIRLLEHLPSDMGVAIVIVNHLRVVATRLHEILPCYTKMPVVLITEGLVLQPNQVFIIPAQRDLHVLDGEFHLEPISKPRGWPDVITVFLRSLTRHWNGKIIAVIVSGYDGDGAAALCGIKKVGGITIAQKLETAVQPDMPESAIESGYIDFILSPEDIARKIIQIASNAGELLLVAGLDNGRM